MTLQTEGSSILAETRWNAARLDRLAGRVSGAGQAEDHIVVTAPAVDEPIGRVPRVSGDAVDAAIEEATVAQTTWAEREPSERAAVLDRFAGLVERNVEELLDLIQLETGKARRHAMEEVIDPSITADYYAETGPRLLEDEDRRGAIPVVTTTEVVHEPVGVVGIISPWNYPLALSLTDAIPALMAGNSVVIKPDEKTPYTALRLLELMIDAGLPRNACQIITGDGPVVGERLVEGVDYVTFTGSTETGRLVAAQAGRNLIDCSVELSGKNPLLVLADAPMDRTVRGVIQACFTNAGQICLSAERVYVEEPIYDEFLETLVTATEDIELGFSFEYDEDVGSLIGADHHAKVAEHVEDARDRGATIEAGGQARPDVGPFFYEPTILTDLPESSLPACEETFGPVIAVESVPSVEAGIDRANDSEHGLNASVWTADRKRGAEIAREIDCGTVCVNDGYASGYAAVDAPMGGKGDSGIGRRQGPEGLKRYVEPKTIATSRVGPIDPPPVVPDGLYASASIRISRAYRRLRKVLR